MVLRGWHTPAAMYARDEPSLSSPFGEGFFIVRPCLSAFCFGFCGFGRVRFRVMRLCGRWCATFLFVLMGVI